MAAVLVHMASVLTLLPDSKLRKIAAFDITDSLNLYDPRFGSAGSVEVACPTCGMHGDVCTGHHAYMSLGIKLFHPLVYKESQNILNNSCLACGQELSNIDKFKYKRCTSCNHVYSGNYTIKVADIRLAVKPSNEELFAETIPECVLPAGHIISGVLVPPIHLRTLEDMEWPTDVQKLYDGLTAAIRSGKGESVQSAYCKMLGLYKNDEDLYNESLGRKDGLMGIMSGKNGIFRQLMMGKRVERSARAVIVGDPLLQLDQVSIPKVVAKSISVRTACTKNNIGELKEMASDNALWWPSTEDAVCPWNITEGMEFDRKIKDGDLAMLNGQPSLSRVSLMCFRTVVRNDGHSVFAINPQVTTPFNADFDGDEMNIFFMRNSAEMLGMCDSKSCTQGLPHVQDVVTGCYLMSEDNVPVSKEVWGDCMVILGRAEPAVYPQTTHGLLSAAIPGYGGETLNKEVMPKLGFVNTYTLQLMVERWLSTYGLTVSIRSLYTPGNAIREGESDDAFKERCIIKVEEELAGTGLMSIIKSGAKGSVVHAAHMAVAIGKQHIRDREGIFCKNSYSTGLNPDEFFGHQIAAREGVVSTGVSTASKGYLNRRACKIMADVTLRYNDTVADEKCVSSFHL